MMPQLDGFGLIKALRTDADLRDVPVILVSARAGEESRIEGLDAGADDYLVKPFSARELLARVGAILERARLHRQVLDEQRKARQISQRRAAQFETLLGKAPLGVSLLDSQLRIREINPTSRPVFGDIPDLIGADIRDIKRRLWEPKYAEEVIGIFEHTLATGDPHIRLIALTGYGQRDDRQRALAAGFDDHLVKPVEPLRLALALEPH